MIDQDAPDQLGRERKEVITVPPFDLSLIDETKISLVDKCRTLQRVIRPLAPEIRLGKAAQFVIDQRSEIFESTLITLFPFRQQLGDVLRAVTHGSNSLLLGGVLDFLSSSRIRT